MGVYEAARRDGATVILDAQGSIVARLSASLAGNRLISAGAAETDDPDDPGPVAKGLAEAMGKARRGAFASERDRGFVPGIRIAGGESTFRDPGATITSDVWVVSSEDPPYTVWARLSRRPSERGPSADAHEFADLMRLATDAGARDFRRTLGPGEAATRVPPESRPYRLGQGGTVLPRGDAHGTVKIPYGLARDREAAWEIVEAMNLAFGQGARAREAGRALGPFAVVAGRDGLCWDVVDADAPGETYGQVHRGTLNALLRRPAPEDVHVYARLIYAAASAGWSSAPAPEAAPAPR